MEGTNITLNHCYPTATSAFNNGILAAANVVATDGWAVDGTVAGGAGAGAILQINLSDATTPASCSVTYTAAGGSTSTTKTQAVNALLADIAANWSPVTFANSLGAEDMVLTDLIVKAITSPFTLLASAFGGGGDELSTVNFAPGSAVLSAEAAQGLDKVAKALVDRPALKMTVLGAASLEAEREGYKREHLQALVRAEKRRALVVGGTAADASAVVTVRWSLSKWNAEAGESSRWNDPSSWW